MIDVNDPIIQEIARRLEKLENAVLGTDIQCVIEPAAEVEERYGLTPGTLHSQHDAVLAARIAELDAMYANLIATERMKPIEAIASALQQIGCQRLFEAMERLAK